MDAEYNEYTITSVEPYEGGFTVGLGDGGCLCVRNPDNLPLPTPSQVARLYGRGFGYPVRGFAAITDGTEIRYYYESSIDYDSRVKREQEESDRKQCAEWTARKNVFLADVAELPDAFKHRIQRFLDNRDNWGWRYGDYELFSCKEAVKFADKLKTTEAIRDFHAADISKQRELVPDMSDGHSGNTFGTACFLARCYIERPELVPKAHGALCPLVGCEAYGCYASEAARAAGGEQ